LALVQLDAGKVVVDVRIRLQPLREEGPEVALGGLRRAGAERQRAAEATVDDAREGGIAQLVPQLAEDHVARRQVVVEARDLLVQRVGARRAFEERLDEGDLRRGLEAIDDREDIEQLDPVLHAAQPGPRGPAIAARQLVREALAGPGEVAGRLALRPARTKELGIDRLRELRLVERPQEREELQRAVREDDHALAGRRQREPQRSLDDDQLVTHGYARRARLDDPPQRLAHDLELGRP